MRKIMLVLVAISLTACGSSREDRSVAACVDALEQKFSDQTIKLDPADMRASATAEGDDIIVIQSTIVFDPGMEREYSQGLNCRTRVRADGGTPDVITLTFDW